MKTALFPLMMLIMLNGCASTPTEHTESDKIPYPNTDLQYQIDHLSMEVARLQNRLDELEKQEQTNPTTQPKRKPRTTSQIAENETTPIAQPISNQAQIWFQQKQYQRVIQHINQHENSNTISEKNLHLLIQSHYQLNNCQSVIDLSRRYLSRFRTHAQAPNVMHQTGWCQWKIQQKDIARDTWRQLIRIYPHSKIAEKARADLKK